MHVPNISGIKCTVFLPNSEDSRLKQTQEFRVYNSEFFFPMFVNMEKVLMVNQILLWSEEQCDMVISSVINYTSWVGYDAPVILLFIFY